MTKHGEGKSTNSTSAAKHERSKRIYLAKCGKASKIFVDYCPLHDALRKSGL